MAPPGKLEITIKINEIPKVRNVENGWKEFSLNCDGQLVTVKVKPKVFKKLEDAQANYPMWVAAVGGKLGAQTTNGFIHDCSKYSSVRAQAEGGETRAGISDSIRLSDRYAEGSLIRWIKVDNRCISVHEGVGNHYRLGIT